MRQTFSKTLLLISLLPKAPVEFYDRLVTLLEVRLEQLGMKTPMYQPRQWPEIVEDVGVYLGTRFDDLLSETALREIEGEVRRRTDQIQYEAPFSRDHNADFALARLCYAVCRAIDPGVVLETGVAYGVTSAFILKALEVNGRGTLHSVDLPPLGREVDRFVGILIPEALKHRWRLHRGMSKRVLPSLLPQLGKVDVFVHDSLHTYRNMHWEFRIVSHYLAPRAVVIADDVNYNLAFSEWVAEINPSFWGVIQEVGKNSLFGVSVLLDANPHCS